MNDTQTCNKVSTNSAQFIRWLNKNTYTIPDDAYNPREQMGRVGLHNDSDVYDEYRQEFYKAFSMYTKEFGD